MKKYMPIKPTENENSLCLEVLYSKGGYNWYNGDNERRGYYLHCTPVLLKTDSLSNGIFDKNGYSRERIQIAFKRGWQKKRKIRKRGKYSRRRKG